jgi:hypothetical protein
MRRAGVLPWRAYIVSHPFSVFASLFHPFREICLRRCQRPPPRVPALPFILFGDAEHSGLCCWVVELLRDGSSLLGALAPVLGVVQDGVRRAHGFISANAARYRSTESMRQSTPFLLPPLLLGLPASAPAPPGSCT